MHPHKHSCELSNPFLVGRGAVCTCGFNARPIIPSAYATPIDTGPLGRETDVEPMTDIAWSPGLLKARVDRLVNEALDREERLRDAKEQHDASA